MSNTAAQTPLSLEQLVTMCQHEIACYRATNEESCPHLIDLFRRALCQSDQGAWTVLYTCFAPLVFFWARRYGRSYSWLREEEYPVLVNQAFAKFAIGMSHHALSDFATIGQCLTYLRRCVFSVVIDEARATRSQQLHDPLEPYDTLLAPDDVEAETLSALSAASLWQQVLAVVSREEERVVLIATYEEGSAPATSSVATHTYFPPSTRCTRRSGGCVVDSSAAARYVTIAARWGYDLLLRKKGSSDCVLDSSGDVPLS
jgi:DNA-directed RNA polymerase specialized sigma24 family protein